jgi:adenylyl cyclase-associated protein
MTAIQPFFKPYMDAKETIRPGRDDWELHMKTCGEVFGMLQWIMITPKPKEYAAEMVGACDFWSNKLRVQYKGKDEKQIAWVDALKGLLQGLVAYIKDHHLAGVAYNNAKGGQLGDAKADAPPPAPAAAAPPAAAPKAAEGGGVGGVMAELARKKAAAANGDSAAVGLKAVSKDQQTWRADYKPKDAPVVAKPKVAPRAGPKSIVTGPPVCEFKDAGMKWCVENQQKENGVITINVTDPKHQVYIFKCDGATIDIKGKCKGVVVDTAVKTNVLMDSVISSCEVVNCKRMQVQVRGMCPSVAIDKTDGILVYLSKETAGETTFVTSKSSEMNVSWPDDNDDMQEKCIPEQFQHKLDPKSGSISSDISDLYSH